MCELSLMTSLTKMIQVLQFYVPVALFWLSLSCPGPPFSPCSWQYVCMNFFNFVKKLFIFYYFRGHFSRFSQIQWHCRWLRLGVKRGGLELGFGYAFVCSVDHWDMNVSLCVDVCLCWLWLWLHDHHLHSASTFLWTLLIWTLSLGHLSLCFLPVIPSLHRLCSVISVACFLINL